jgi:nitrogen fixation NifU-like protein
MLMFQEELIDHYRFPRNKGCMDDADFSADDKNPSCGDRVRIQGKIQGDKLARACFQAEGCILSQATTSLLLEACYKKSIKDILALSHDDILRMIGMQVGPTRARCALLSLHVLRYGLTTFLSNQTLDITKGT